jgi:hypothetical protein
VPLAFSVLSIGVPSTRPGVIRTHDQGIMRTNAANCEMIGGFGVVWVSREGDQSQIRPTPYCSSTESALTIGIASTRH